MSPFAAKFSPWEGGLVAIASARNFGLKGSGRLSLLQRMPSTSDAAIAAQLDFKDGLFDVAWSEVDSRTLVTGGGDGAVHLVTPANPLAGAQSPSYSPGSLALASRAVYRHAREVSSVDWSPHRQDRFVSASWDGTVVLHCSARGSSRRVIELNRNIVVHETRWSPRHANLLACVASDGIVRVVDERLANGLVASLHSPLDDDLLSLDWNKYDDAGIATAGPTDLRIWDLRSTNTANRPAAITTTAPVLSIPGAHHRAIKRIRYSPWSSHNIASVGCDFALRLWDTAALNPRLGEHEGFTEFAMGVDWNLFVRNELVTASWDESIRIHQCIN
jgi:peroxin-7